MGRNPSLVPALHAHLRRSSPHLRCGPGADGAAHDAAGSDPWDVRADASWRQAPAGLGFWETWGVPELADYDVILDAGADGSDPENAVPFDLKLPDGRVLKKPGNFFFLTETALFGTNPKFLDKKSGLPDPAFYLAAARDLGTPAAGPRALATTSEPLRRMVDAQLIRSERIRLTTNAERPSGACPVLGPTGSAALRMTLPAAGASSRNGWPCAPASVFLVSAGRAAPAGD